MLGPKDIIERLTGRRALSALRSELAVLREEARFAAGTQAALQMPPASNVRSLCEVEFRAFSQSGEDGIIQFLVREVDVAIDEEIFVEFGVEDYSEANTRFLLEHDNWRGLIIDGDPGNIDHVKGSKIFWRYELHAIAQFITPENINHLIESAGISGPIGLLSIDIDGNDYWVFQAINVVRPKIVVVEYNGVFGPEADIAIPYEPDFTRTSAHHSNLYFGASLTAFRRLADERGYSLVGTNRAGSNAFFVRREAMTDELQRLSDSFEFRPSRIRESRDPSGKLNYATGAERLKLISDMPVIDFRTGKTQAIREVTELKDDLV